MGEGPERRHKSAVHLTFMLFAYGSDLLVSFIFSKWKVLLMVLKFSHQNNCYKVSGLYKNFQLKLLLLFRSSKKTVEAEHFDRHLPAPSHQNGT